MEISINQITKRYKISKQYVGKCWKDGKIKKISRGIFDFDDCEKLWGKKTDEIQSIKKAYEKLDERNKKEQVKEQEQQHVKFSNESLENAKNNFESTGNIHVDKEILNVKKLQREVELKDEQIKKLDIENKQKESKMIDRTAFERAIANSYGACKNTFEAIPKKLAPKLVSLIMEGIKNSDSEIKIIREVIIELDLIINKTLTNIASVHNQLELSEIQIKEEITNENVQHDSTSFKT